MNNPSVLNKRQLFITTMFASKFEIPMEEIVSFLTKIRMEDMVSILEEINISNNFSHTFEEKKKATTNEDQPTANFIKELINTGRLV